MPNLTTPIFQGAIEILVLWIAIVATMVLFFRVKKWTALPLFPYLVWVTFATCLSWSIWSLNRDNPNI